MNNVNTITLRSVQVCLLRSTYNGIQIYLQQRHESLNSYPGKWAPQGGVIDELQNFTDLELDQLTHTIINSRYLDELGKSTLAAVRDSLFVNIYDKKEISLYDESLARKRSIQRPEKETMLLELLKSIKLEHALQSNSCKAGLNNLQLIQYIETITAKREIREETGLDISNLSNDHFEILRRVQSKTAYKKGIDRIYMFPVYVIDVTSLPTPSYNHDEVYRKEHALPDRLEAMKDTWLSLEEAAMLDEQLSTKNSIITFTILKDIAQALDTNCAKDLIKHLKSQLASPTA